MLSKDYLMRLGKFGRRQRRALPLVLPPCRPQTTNGPAASRCIRIPSGRAQAKLDALKDKARHEKKGAVVYIHTAEFVHARVLLAAGFALCFGESIYLT
jgi:hypothetical protein